MAINGFMELYMYSSGKGCGAYTRVCTKMKCLLILLGGLACLHLVSSQCTIENLNSSTLVRTLLARSLVSGTQSTLPTLTVRDHAIVCLAVSTAIDQYRFASVVVSYNCTGTCPGGTSGVVSQVEFGCNSNVWSEIVSGTPEGNVQHSPEATLQTQLRSDCQTCINPGREGSAEEPNHCISCSSCLPPDEGLNMCTGAGASQCCNVNTGGQCRQSCPPGTITDPDFICRANCSDPLPTALFQSEAVNDPACTYSGCTATYTCDEGLTLSDLTSTSYQLSCLGGNGVFTANWDVNTRTCSQQCNFVHNPNATERGITPMYEPSGCNAMFGTTNCVANYTSTNGSASCNCTLNDTTGMISCFSDEVMSLILDTPPTSTPGRLTTRDIIIVVVVVIAGVSMIALTAVILGGITYYYYKKNKNKQEETTDKFQLTSRHKQ